MMLNLQSKAKEMVMLAEKMRQKLLSGSNSQTNATNEEEMGTKEEMQDWLLSVGIISPVTKESAGAMYHQQLSRQVLSSVLVIMSYFRCYHKIVRIDVLLRKIVVITSSIFALTFKTLILFTQFTVGDFYHGAFYSFHF